ncbi:class I SAM-dependent methyltransferase [Kibdelosporangium persicum]|uniref:Ubiquinone/menaquinone biosynthesis methyltransferase n=1 Tax=Kibdelosporangium persicum TaxID=2698649 RepID=A0ABX2F8I4_9PSEU|nr:methyltransferase domain-containing protein [Kibdelosporangium persicum]NRN67656.1 Ubiquinone/menaquinone biosynthesis methyltransferase [Kibdelosporangium persicum]
MADHNEAIRAQFRIQAATFDDTGFAVAGLDWIVTGLEPSPTDMVLDVAAGAAHVGRALAPHVAHVSALDLTPEMLHQGQRLAVGAGLRNIAFLTGDAVALPWLDGQFDLTVCRLALHQVADPGAVVREMVRVTRPGGRIGVIDLTAVDDPAAAAEADRIERLRDPSHATTLTAQQIHDLLGRSGAEVTSVTAHDQPVEVEDWMERTRTEPVVRDVIRARFDEELRGGRPSGLRPFRDDTDALWLTHTWTMTVGRKTSDGSPA